MLMIGFISADKALMDAVLEQMKQLPDWQLATFESPAAAMEVWQERKPPLVLWDAEQNSAHEAAQFYSFIQQEDTAPWLLTIGSVPLAKEITDQMDGLERPLRIGRLLSRLQFYKRRLQQPETKSYQFGGYEFHPRQNKLISDDKEIKLTDKESALLESLARAEKPISREMLLEDIWGYGPSVDTHTLETHIYRLRQKLMARNPEGDDCFLASQGSYMMNKQWAES